MPNIIRPLITEKTLTLAARGWYTFTAKKEADKKQIAQEIAALYNVKVINVRTAMMHGKMRRVGKMQKYMKKPDWKKVSVELVKGQKIDAFEVTSEQPGKSTETKPVKAEK